MEEISYSGGSKSIKKKFSKRVVLFAVFFIIILILIGGVIFFVTRKGSSTEEDKKISLPESQETTEAPSPVVSNTPTPTSKLTPTPTAVAIKLDKSTLRVSVQNGSGESGVAGKGSTILKTAGYNVVSTGNADNYDYKNVTIKVKSTKKGFLPLLEKDLSKDYTIGDTSEDLVTDASYDALVIIGK